MADDEASGNKFALFVSNFLLNPEIKDEYTLDEFRNCFPTKYRYVDWRENRYITVYYNKT